MRLCGFLFIFFSLFSFLQAQDIIRGYVYEWTTKVPITGASVYLDGTTIGAVTDSTGYFNLITQYPTTARLTIRYLGFETQSKALDNKKTLYRIGLMPKIEFLNEVVIEDDPYSRRQKLKVFKEEFLGLTTAGYRCTIINEEALQLRYDIKTKSLYAEANVPLIIKNTYLGYELVFDLKDFEVVFKTNDLLKKGNIARTLFRGTSFFKDISNRNPRIEKRRIKSYLGSPMHFMRATKKGKWDKNRFNVKWKSDRAKYSDYVSDSLINGFTVFALKGKLQIKYYDQVSYIYMLKGEVFYIDNYGNYSPGTDVVFEGAMSQLRIGDLLPLDITIEKH